MTTPSQEIQDGVNVLKLLGEVSRENYLEAMWIMDYNYPAHGWNEAAKDLEAFYEQIEKREQKEREAYKAELEAARQELETLKAEKSATQKKQPFAPWEVLAADIDSGVIDFLLKETDPIDSLLQEILPDLKERKNFS